MRGFAGLKQRCDLLVPFDFCTEAIDFFKTRNITGD
jgi:hypothetical protein